MSTRSASPSMDGQRRTRWGSGPSSSEFPGTGRRRRRIDEDLALSRLRARPRGRRAGRGRAGTRGTAGGGRGQRPAARSEARDAAASAGGTGDDGVAGDRKRSGGTRRASRHARIAAARHGADLPHRRAHPGFAVLPDVGRRPVLQELARGGPRRASPRRTLVPRRTRARRDLVRGRADRYMRRHCLRRSDCRAPALDAGERADDDRYRGILGAALRKALAARREDDPLRRLHRSRSRALARDHRPRHGDGGGRTVRARRPRVDRREGVLQRQLHDPVRRERSRLRLRGPWPHRGRAQALHRGRRGVALRRIPLKRGGGMGMRVRVALLVCLVGGSAAFANAEDDAARTFAALHEKPGADPRQQVAQMLGALDAAGLHNLGTVALGDLLQEGAAEVRAAAAQELSKRAANGGVGLALLLRAPAAGLPSATAVKLARAHLERALVVAPPEEGSSFAPMQGRAAEPTPVAATEAAPAPETVSAAQKLASSELALSRILAASVPAGDAAEGDARETEALAALAAGDVDAAQAAFEAVVKVSVKGDEASARHERAVLQLARLAYARGDDARAQAWYSKISRAAPEWLDALFESSWSHFRNGDDDKALGNLLTLHAPFFQGRYYPESYVLKALVLYENCRYPEARRTLREFEARYRPLHDGLAGALERMPTAQTAVTALSQPGGLASFPEGSRDEVARVISAPELKTGLSQVSEMAQELDSIDRRPSFQRTALARAALPRLREARLDLLQSVGDRVRSRLSLERGELRELLGQGLRLDFEIAGREKEIAETPDGAVAPAAQHRTPPTVDEDEVLWPFEGEYWRDELGSYRYQLGEKCAKPRPAPAKPVRTAATSVASDAVATPGPAALH